MFMFIYCKVMLPFVAITNGMLNKISNFVFYWRTGGHGRVSGSAGGHGPKKGWEPLI